MIPLLMMVGIVLDKIIPIFIIILVLRSYSPFWNFTVTFIATGPVSYLLGDWALSGRSPDVLFLPEYIFSTLQFAFWLSLIAFGAGLYPARRKTSLAIMVAGIVLFFATRPMVIWWLIMMPSFFGLMSPLPIVPPGNI